MEVPDSLNDGQGVALNPVTLIEQELVHQTHFRTSHDPENSRLLQEGNDRLVAIRSRQR
jgi:hypothetical protein